MLSGESHFARILVLPLLPLQPVAMALAWYNILAV